VTAGVFGLAAGASGCGEVRSDDNSTAGGGAFGTGGGGDGLGDTDDDDADGTVGGDDDADGTVGGDDDDDDDDDGAVFDLPPGNADGGLPSDGCSKVDFLFIIDNSISMGDEQQNLATSFPSFIQTIQTDVVDDFHVMVIDTDGEDKWDEELVECQVSDCVGEPPDEPCGILPPENNWTCGNLPTEDVCDATLGAGIDHDDSDARNSCGLLDGRRWFSDAQPDPGAAFDCVAHLYDGNSPELTMGGMLAALDPGMNGPGGCNEGFLRDDAVLVVTFISDEEDDGDSMGDPLAWRDELLALKGGNETAVVMLGLLGDTGVPGAVCPPDSVPGSNGGEYAPRLIEVVESFGTRGVWGSVCAPDYAPFFDEAVGLIDSACDEYEPEG